MGGRLFVVCVGKNTILVRFDCLFGQRARRRRRGGGLLLLPGSFFLFDTMGGWLPFFFFFSLSRKKSSVLGLHMPWRFSQPLLPWKREEACCVLPVLSKSVVGWERKYVVVEGVLSCEMIMNKTWSFGEDESGVLELPMASTFSNLCI